MHGAFPLVEDCPISVVTLHLAHVVSTWFNEDLSIAFDAPLALSGTANREDQRLATILFTCECFCSNYHKCDWFVLDSRYGHFSESRSPSVRNGFWSCELNHCSPLADDGERHYYWHQLLSLWRLNAIWYGEWWEQDAIGSDKVILSLVKCLITSESSRMTTMLFVLIEKTKGSSLITTDTRFSKPVICFSR